jgi:hypothetical protein
MDGVLARLSVSRAGCMVAFAVGCVWCRGRVSAEDCPVAQEDRVLPSAGVTQPPSFALPVPPTGNDCDFYNSAWHAFLYVTRENRLHRPAFLSYPTIETVFPAAFKAPRAGVAGNVNVLTAFVRNQEPMLNVARRSAHALAAAGDGFTDITQAAQSGIGSILVDRNRNPIFYSIHLNAAFAAFVRDNGLDDIPRLFLDPSDTDTAKASTAVPSDLEFRPGTIEMKASWMIVEGAASAFSTYFLTTVKIPHLKVVKIAGGDQIVIDTTRPMRSVTVALLGLHVVAAIDGHPELIWASFEHADEQGHRDVAPSAHENPVAGANGPETKAIDNADRDYPIFAKGTRPADANAANPPQQFDEKTQKFLKSTPIFRVFPGSQSTKPPDGDQAAPWEDPAVFNLNKHIGERFAKVDPQGRDSRRNYRLVAAVWLDAPRAKQTGQNTDNFNSNTSFDNDDVRFAGENRLSNVAVESFTQPAAAAPNCFACHDTSEQNVALNGKKLPARRINVSHVFDIAARNFLLHTK